MNLVEVIQTHPALSLEDVVKLKAELAVLRAHDAQWEEAIIAVLPPMPDEPGEVELAREIAKKIRARIASGAPIVSLRFTCPFDGAMWAFHSQEQLDMIQAHLDAHAAREKA